MDYHVIIGVLLGACGAFFLVRGLRRPAYATSLIGLGIALNAPRYLVVGTSWTLRTAIVGLGLIVLGLFFKMRIRDQIVAFED